MKKATVVDSLISIAQFMIDNQVMELMKEFCSSNGYYDVFIPAMRRLSPLYNEYYEQMLRANEEFIKKHPEYIDKQ